MIQIEFTKFGCCSAIGNFAPKDRARVSADMARHLVDEVGCAKYIQEAPVVAESPKPRKRKDR